MYYIPWSIWLGLLLYRLAGLADLHSWSPCFYYISRARIAYYCALWFFHFPYSIQQHRRSVCLCKSPDVIRLEVHDLRTIVTCSVTLYHRHFGLLDRFPTSAVLHDDRRAHPALHWALRSHYSSLLILDTLACSFCAPSALNFPAILLPPQGIAPTERYSSAHLNVDHLPLRVAVVKTCISLVTCFYRDMRCKRAKPSPLSTTMQCRSSEPVEESFKTNTIEI